MTLKPLYMWAGGKNKMIPKYRENPGIPVRGYTTYVEPFFGSGAMMLYVAQHNPYIKKFVINDINPEIMGIYRAIKNDVETFIKVMDALEERFIPLDKPDRKTFYYDMRMEYMTDYQKWDRTTESGVLYFLMKTGFNGIWQTCKVSQGRFGTPSGLLNQKTNVYDKNNVIEWNTFLQKVDIHSIDWKKLVYKIKEKMFIFVDPPYRGSFTQYGQTFTDDDQQECIEFCNIMSEENSIVMFCGRETGDDFYIKHKGNLNIDYYNVTYTAGRRKQKETENGTTFHAKLAREILIHNIS